MDEIYQLKQAIASLESQRAALGDAVTDASIAAVQEKLHAISPARTGDRRKLVTVLFADLAGWVQLSERADPEDLRLLQAAYYNAVTPVITGFGGAVEKYIGDAVLAVFGVPQAHEDDAVRAVRAALAMHEALAEVSDLLLNGPSSQSQLSGLAGFRPDVLLSGDGLPLRMRIGIHSGLVLSTVREAGDFLIIGDTVNLASRLQEAAEIGSVLISEETRRLVDHAFQVEPRHRLPVKGLSEPVTAFRVVAAWPERPGPPVMAGRTSSLVGRQAELAVLEEVICSLHGGTGAVVTVVGDAGLGKSRLVAEVAEREAGRSVQWIVGRCLSYGNSIPLHLWVDLLRSAANVPVDAGADRLDGQLRIWIDRYCPEHFDEVYEPLAKLLSLATGKNGNGNRQSVNLLQVDGQQSKRAVFRAVETLVGNGTVNIPLVIVCEDLHWADPSSVELLEHLVRMSRTIPLLLICLLRPEAGDPVWSLLGKLGHIEDLRHINLRLKPLSFRESETLVASLLGCQPDSAELPSARGGGPATLLSRVMSRAEGNPFFLEEAVRSLMDSGALVRDAATNCWQVLAEQEQLAIPDSVQAVLGARIDGLDLDARQILQLAAVVGRDFSVRVLADVVQEDSTLERNLAILRDQGFIVEGVTQAGPAYRFRHALAREVTYNSLLRSERRAYHRRVAEAIEGGSRDFQEDRSDILAWHWQQAGDGLKAIRFLQQAGDRARELGASLEAIKSYRTALELLGGLESVEDLPGAYDLHERLGDVSLEHLSDNEAARLHYTAFSTLASAPTDQARAARKLGTIDLMEGDLGEAEGHFRAALDLLGALPGSVEANRVHCGTAYLRLSQGRLEEAAQLAGWAEKSARQIDDARGLADAYRILGIIADLRGDPRLSLDYARRCLPLYDNPKDLHRMAQACNNAADCCRKLGLSDEAMRYLAQGRALADRLSDTRDQALLLVTEAELLLDLGRSAEAIALVRGAVPLAKESGVVGRIIAAQQVLGLAYAAQGDHAQASHHLESALALSEDTRFGRFTLDVMLDLVHLAAQMADFPAAERRLSRARQAAGEDPNPALARRLLRTAGFLALRQQRWEEAVGDLEASLEVAGPSEPAIPWAETRHLLGQALAGRGGAGDREAACGHLQRAAAVFGRVGAASRAATVQRALDDLGCGP